MSNRRAIAFLGADHIARLLALPEGLHVVACRDDFMRNGVAVLIEGDALDEQEPGVELPRLPVEMSDPSALARQATVIATWRNDQTAGFEVLCPVWCGWEQTYGHSVTLALLADAVQQHLNDKHAGGERT